MEFVPQKIKKLEYMAAKNILYYVLNMSISLHVADGFTVHARNFKVVLYKMEKIFFVIFVNLDLIIIQNKCIKLLIQKNFWYLHFNEKRIKKLCKFWSINPWVLAVWF